MYTRITWPELPPMPVQYTGHVIQTEARDNNTGAGDVVRTYK